MNRIKKYSSKLFFYSWFLIIFIFTNYRVMVTSNKTLEKFEDLMKIIFVDKEFSKMIEFETPNIISVSIFIFIIVLLLNIIENSKNRTIGSYSLIQYRTTKRAFINHIIFDLFLKFVEIYLLFAVLCVIGILFFEYSEIGMIYLMIYFFRLSLLLLMAVLFFRFFYIFYKDIKISVIQYLFLIILAMLDNYLGTCFITMSGDITTEFIGIIVILILIIIIGVSMKYEYLKKGDIL